MQKHLKNLNNTNLISTSEKILITGYINKYFIKLLPSEIISIIYKLYSKQALKESAEAVSEGSFAKLKKYYKLGLYINAENARKLLLAKRSPHLDSPLESYFKLGKNKNILQNALQQHWLIPTKITHWLSYPLNILEDTTKPRKWWLSYKIKNRDKGLSSVIALTINCMFDLNYSPKYTIDIDLALSIHPHSELIRELHSYTYSANNVTSPSNKIFVYDNKRNNENKLITEKIVKPISSHIINKALMLNKFILLIHPQPEKTSENHEQITSKNLST